MRKSCRSRKTRKDAPSLAIGGANFAKIWLKFWQIFDKILRMTYRNPLDRILSGRSSTGRALRYPAGGRSTSVPEGQRAAVHPSLFPRLVLSCIDADRNEKWRIFQHFSKSTVIYTFSWKLFENNQNLMILLKFSENSGDSGENSKIFSKMFIIFWKKCENRVDLEKRWKMRPLSLSEVPILLKFD